MSDQEKLISLENWTREGDSPVSVIKEGLEVSRVMRDT